MSTGFYLVCDETRLYCAIACSTMGRAGDYGSTERGKFAFVISHRDFKLRIVDEHADAFLVAPYRDWEDLEGADEIRYSLTPEEAAELCAK